MFCTTGPSFSVSSAEHVMLFWFRSTAAPTQNKSASPSIFKLERADHQRGDLVGRQHNCNSAEDSQLSFRPNESNAKILMARMGRRIFRLKYHACAGTANAAASNLENWQHTSYSRLVVCRRAPLFPDKNLFDVRLSQSHNCLQRRIQSNNPRIRLQRPDPLQRDVCVRWNIRAINAVSACRRLSRIARWPGNRPIATRKVPRKEVARSRSRRQRNRRNIAAIGRLRWSRRAIVMHTRRQ